MSGTNSCDALRLEIAAFYGGFGQPELLREEIRQAALLVPLIDGDRVYTSRLGGAAWVCAFTSIEEYARYMSARGVDPDQDYRHHTLLGGHLAAPALLHVCVQQARGVGFIEITRSQRDIDRAANPRDMRHAIHSTDYPVHNPRCSGKSFDPSLVDPSWKAAA